MTHEVINTEWFDDKALRLPSYKVGRVNFGNGRAYIRINEGGILESPLKVYTSLTTAINTCAPMEKPLLEWYVRLGMQEAARQLTMAQHYGTLMHLEIGKFLVERCYDFGLAQEVVDNYLSEHNYWQPECAGWADRIKKDVAAFMQFAIDYKIVPLGIEYVLLSDKGFGTLIDLVCEMTIQETGFFGEVYKTGDRKGDPKLSKQDKVVTAIINFKSGKHGFYRSNGIQIEAERMLWEENFPDIPIQVAANWAPKEWEINPTYTFKDWTGEIDAQEVDAVLQLAKIRYGSKAESKTYVSINGIASTQESLIAAINKENIEQYCTRKFSSTPV